MLTLQTAAKDQQKEDEKKLKEQEAELLVSFKIFPTHESIVVMYITCTYVYCISKSLLLLTSYITLPRCSVEHDW